MEPVFQKVLPVLFGERPASPDEEQAVEKIHAVLVATAARIFSRSARFRGVDCDADAAAQMWFISIRAARQSYDSARPFRHYAYRTLSNVCCGLGRRARLRQATTISADVVASSPAPWELPARRESWLRVRRALRDLKHTGRMSREHRTVIALRYYRGLSSDEAGQVMGASAQKIDKWAYQARQLLGTELRKGA